MFVKVQLPDDEMDAVHAMRGSVPMSAWIRDLVHDTLVASNALRAVVDAEPARGRGPVMEPAAASSEPVVYSPGREGGAPASRVGRTLAEMSGKGAFQKASKGKR
jgi:hypothetical protein